MLAFVSRLLLISENLIRCLCEISEILIQSLLNFKTISQFKSKLESVNSELQIFDGFSLTVILLAISFTMASYHVYTISLHKIKLRSQFVFGKTD